MQRVQVIARIIGEQVGLSEEELMDLQRAAEIYKFDLVTNMVGEFPELQGIMGEKYALLKGEKPAVATAIREHYMPISSEGDLPETTVGSVLAIADKLDSIFFFLCSWDDPKWLKRSICFAPSSIWCRSNHRIEKMGLSFVCSARND